LPCYTKVYMGWLERGFSPVRRKERTIPAAFVVEDGGSAVESLSNESCSCTRYART
jgi:hypothetical protein